ncbi:radical SAM protein [Patescibacteria group bacterium]
MKYVYRGLKNIVNSGEQHSRGVAWQSLKNYGWAFLKFPSRVPVPTEIQLEPSALCNLKCKMCTLDKNIVGDKFLTRQKFKKLLRDVGPLKTINFTGMGESLLNKDLEFFIRETKQKGIETYFITNGQLLSPQRSRQLIQAGLDKIAISIESADPKIYKEIRGGVSLSKLKLNLAGLESAIIEHRAKLEVGFNVVLLKENINDLSSLYKIIDLLDEFGFHFISFQNVHDVCKSGTLPHFKESKSLLMKNLMAIKEYCQRKGIEVSLPSVAIKPESCYYPWIYPFITAAGELLPCCIIPQFGTYQKIIDKYSWGNIFASNFTKVWNNSKAVAFRKSLAGKQPDRHCRQCAKYLNIL